MPRIKTLRERERDNDWPEPPEFKTAEECVRYYETDGIGCMPDPEGAEECEAQEDGVFADAAHKYGIADSGAGKLILAYDTVWKVSGRNDWFHGSKSQPTGDCVSRSNSHALITSLACSVYNGKGSWPEIPESLYQTGMPFSPTGTYWLKHGGVSGWSCSAAAARSKDGIGIVVAKPYSNPNIGNLLTPQEYKTSSIGKYTRSGPPSDVVADLDDHKAVSYSRIRSFEEIRDALANGYGVSSCGGQGFSKTRDANGVSRRSGHWSHAMAYVGTDDTKWAHDNYGGPLVLVLNSWGVSWIHGPRKVQGKDDYPEIPKGSFWARWSEVQGRDCYTFSAVNGFPPQKLAPLNLQELI